MVKGKGFNSDGPGFSGPDFCTHTVSLEVHCEQVPRRGELAPDYGACGGRRVVIAQTFLDYLLCASVGSLGWFLLQGTLGEGSEPNWLLNVTWASWSPKRSFLHLAGLGIRIA